MTRDIRATRDRLGLTTAGLATLVGVKNRTAQRWMAGDAEVPEPVWRLLYVVEWVRRDVHPLRSFDRIVGKAPTMLDQFAAVYPPTLPPNGTIKPPS